MPDIREQLEAKGLGRIAGVIETAVKPSLWLATREESENGVSRLGGRPNLPEEFDWPLWQEQPLAFLAQLNLAALPAVDGLNLPREGALFFFQAAGRDEGWDGVRVLYSDRAVDQSPLREFPDELEAELRFRGFELAVREMVPSIPDFTDQLIEEQQLTEEELEAYQDVAFEWRQRWSEEHRAGGYPDAIQCEDPKLEAHLKSLDLYGWDLPPDQQKKAEEQSPGAKDWELLLQVASDRKAGMMWVDAGLIYFLIHKDDLKERCFDYVWTVMQTS